MQYNIGDMIAERPPVPHKAIQGERRHRDGSIETFRQRVMLSPVLKTEEIRYILDVCYVFILGDKVVVAPDKGIMKWIAEDYAADGDKY